MIAPYAHATGGVELGHQLVDVLRRKGVEAYIVYMHNDSISKKQDVTKEYRKYNIATSCEIEDSISNILVLPEIWFHLTLRYQKISIACWWMSVDNHYINNVSLIDALLFFPSLYQKAKVFYKYLFKGFYRGQYSDKLLKKDEVRITHLYQSFYAQQYLYSKGYSKILPLSDYINSDFESNNLDIKRENIILYNPQKGLEFTKKIIDSDNKYKYIPLVGLTRKELVSLMRRAKLYIDFGHFPGKDRLSREAVINGCCIITGKLGASYFYEDVPISSDYKFEVKESNISSIKNKIDCIMKDYPNHNEEFNCYRTMVMKEKDRFYQQVDDFFI